MEQLNLIMTPNLTYKPEHFVEHGGVSTVLRELQSIILQRGFACSLISGANRSGKTHFSVYLSDWIARQTMFPRLMTGAEFSELILAGSSLQALRSDEVLIIDDVQSYLTNIRPGQSGPFVALYESLRLANVKLVLLSTLMLPEYTFDEHIRSRLQAGSGLSINNPEEYDLLKLIDAMARQRGIKLTGRKGEFLEKRLRRDIPTIENYLERLVHLTSVLGKKVRFEELGDAL